MFLFLLFAALCCCIAVCVLRSTMLLTCDQPKVSASRLPPEPVKNARSPPEQQPVTDVAIVAEMMLCPRLCLPSGNRDGGLATRRKPCASTALGFRPARENARKIPASPGPFQYWEGIRDDDISRICRQFAISGRPDG